MVWNIFSRFCQTDDYLTAFLLGNLYIYSCGENNSTIGYCEIQNIFTFHVSLVSLGENN